MYYLVLVSFRNWSMQLYPHDAVFYKWIAQLFWVCRPKRIPGEPVPNCWKEETFWASLNWQFGMPLVLLARPNSCFSVQYGMSHILAVCFLQRSFFFSTDGTREDGKWLTWVTVYANLISYSTHTCTNELAGPIPFLILFFCTDRTIGNDLCRVKAHILKSVCLFMYIATL